MSETQQQTFDQWCIVEVFGRQVYAGRVTEQTIGGCALLRLDVPAAKIQRREYTADGIQTFEEEVPAYTKLFGNGAIYCMTPCTEEVARAVLAKVATAPVTCVQVPTHSFVCQRRKPPGFMIT